MKKQNKTLLSLSAVLVVVAGLAFAYTNGSLLKGQTSSGGGGLLGSGGSGTSCTDDAYENNDQYSSATPLTEGATLSVRKCDGDEDWFITSGMQEGDTLTFTLESSSSVVFDVMVYSSQSTQVYTSSPSFDFGANLVEVEVPMEDGASYYGFKVDSSGHTTNFAASYTVSYEVEEESAVATTTIPTLPDSSGTSSSSGGDDTVSETASCTDDSREDNDNPFTASSISEGSNVSGVLCNEDNDYYMTADVDGDELEVTVEFNYQDIFTDMEIGFYAENGATIPDSSISTEQTGDAVVFTIDVSSASVQSYGIALTDGFNPSGGVDYVLSYDVSTRPGLGETGETLTPDSCEEDSYEENDSALSAASISSGSTITAHYCDEDADNYRTSSLSGDTLRVVLNYDRSLGLTDLDVSVYPYSGVSSSTVLNNSYLSGTESNSGNSTTYEYDISQRSASAYTINVDGSTIRDAGFDYTLSYSVQTATTTTTTTTTDTTDQTQTTTSSTDQQEAVTTTQTQDPQGDTYYYYTYTDVNDSDGDGNTSEELSYYYYYDIAEGDPNYVAIAYLTEEGVINGTVANGHRVYLPDNFLNRAEQVKLFGAAQVSEDSLSDAWNNPSGVSVPSDVSDGKWYSNWVKYAYEDGREWVNGYPDGTFRPNNYVSVVEGIKILVNALGVDDEMVASVSNSVFEDVNTNAWYAPFVELVERWGVLDTNMRTIGVSDSMLRRDVAEYIFRTMAVDEMRATEYNDAVRDAFLTRKGYLHLIP